MLHNVLVEDVDKLLAVVLVLDMGSQVVVDPHNVEVLLTIDFYGAGHLPRHK